MPKASKKTKEQEQATEKRGNTAAILISFKEEKEEGAAQVTRAEDDTDMSASVMEDRADEDLPSNQQALQEEKIAQFFEDHPLFYDMADKEYKNMTKRRHLLEEFAKSLGMDVEMADKIYQRFRNIRTDYHKLRERDAKAKSGSGSSKPFTPLQQWKLKRYAFLKRFYRGNKKTSLDLGSPDTSDNQDSDTQQDVAPAFPSSKMNPAKKLKKAKDKDLTEVLVNLVSESKQELKNLQAALAQASSQSKPTNSPMDETDAWTQWLATVHHTIPKHLWLQYQSEAFALVTKYRTLAQQQQQPQHPE